LTKLIATVGFGQSWVGRICVKQNIFNKQHNKISSRRMIEIRKATQTDHDKIWEIIKKVIATGDTYVFDPNSSKEKMLAYWFGPDKHTYVAILDNQIVGTFVIKDNQPDLGSHIANGAYMTSPLASGQGIGKSMGEFSLHEAKRLGYKAMQFNIVVKSNDRAVRLWQKLGFNIIGEIPEAFNHRKNGLTNAYIMYRKL
jgi:ribosomal protein S18 acetylase RimI-like enzyme